MKIGKVVMPLRTDIRPSSGEVVVAAEFADHVRFWEDFRAALESKQFLNMPARARHPFEKLVQRVAQTLAVASHTRTSDVAVINSGNPQRLLTGTGVNSRVSRSIVTAASASNIAKRNPDGNQRVLS